MEMHHRQLGQVLPEDWAPDHIPGFSVFFIFFLLSCVEEPGYSDM